MIYFILRYNFHSKNNIQKFAKEFALKIYEKSIREKSYCTSVLALNFLQV